MLRELDVQLLQLLMLFFSVFNQYISNADAGAGKTDKQTQGIESHSIAHVDKWL